MTTQNHSPSNFLYFITKHTFVVSFHQLTCNDRLMHNYFGRELRHAKRVFSRALKKRDNYCPDISHFDDLSLCSRRPEAEVWFDSSLSHIIPRQDYDELARRWKLCHAKVDVELLARPENEKVARQIISCQGERSEPVSSELMLTGLFLQLSLEEAKTWRRDPRRDRNSELADRYIALAHYLREDGHAITVCVPWISSWIAEKLTRETEQKLLFDKLERFHHNCQQEGRVFQIWAPINMREGKRNRTRTTW